MLNAVSQAIWIPGQNVTYTRTCNAVWNNASPLNEFVVECVGVISRLKLIVIITVADNYKFLRVIDDDLVACYATTGNDDIY